MNARRVSSKHVRATWRETQTSPSSSPNSYEPATVQKTNQSLTIQRNPYAGVAGSRNDVPRDLSNRRMRD
ncbi:hypothetical protein RB7567 [Rhodopirellula baltica SH 1]|uniref:Uncharacterized protein n=1 Tax=Rhodopirellula baltica (strain DSM 10527 / NCIMB 13988 / SH1) TaxID=243090 RepID=Q7UNI2_RHOBA|nr:hypothetical protein RB7567 [Rhodopirellula baltica SH 1]